MKFTKIFPPVLLVVLFCLLTTVAIRNNKASENSGVLTHERPEASITQTSNERGPVRMIRFVLSENQIYPRNIRVNQGLVNIALEDKTGNSEGLVIERAVNNDRQRTTTIRRVRDHWRGRELRRLTPGQYIVYDLSKPNNQAVLIVEP